MDIYDRLPHHGVYTRLGVSSLHGVGVFAIQDIPEGTRLFPHSASEVRWIAKETVNESEPTPEEQRFYDDFCIQRGDEYGCPVSFNSLTAEWYLNEARVDETPNVRLDENFDLIAARPLKSGEELTIRYTSFSDR